MERGRPVRNGKKARSFRSSLHPLMTSSKVAARLFYFAVVTTALHPYRILN